MHASPLGRLGIGLVCTLLSGAAVLAADRVTGRDFATRSEVIACHGMATTSHPQTVRELLNRGHRVGWDLGGYGG